MQLQAYYKNKKEIQEMLDEQLELLNNSTVKPQPIKDYELVFYAHGGVAFLRHKTIEDFFYRNECAGWVKQLKMMKNTKYFSAYTSILLKKGSIKKTLG